MKGIYVVCTCGRPNGCDTSDPPKYWCWSSECSRARFATEAKRIISKNEYVRLLTAQKGE